MDKKLTKISRNYTKWVNCPKCGHAKYTKFVRGDIWINENGYKVKILDFGFDLVWLFYFDNNNRTSWTHQEFVNQYCFYEKGVK